jgi:hypothetical protein
VLIVEVPLGKFGLVAVVLLRGILLNRRHRRNRRKARIHLAEGKNFLTGR